MKRNVLIFHLGALGDFVLTWPLALALGRLYPQSRIFYVTHAGKGQLAEKALRIDSTDIEAGWHALFAANAALPPASLKLLESAHTVVTFLSDGRDTWADNVRRLSPDANLVHLQPPTLNAPPVGEHASAFIERQLAPWPVLATAVQQILRSIAERGVSGRTAGSGMTLIHPGSGASFKCWPIENFILLAQRFIAAGRQVRFVLGEVELERWSPASLAELSGVAPIEHPENPVDLWKLFTGASMFIGNDSGPAQLAGMAGVSTIVLFGPTSPDIWKPLGPKVCALQKSTSEWCSMSDVLSAAASFIRE